MIRVIAILALCSCAGPQWIATHTCEPIPAPPGIAVDHCSDGALRFRACLLSYGAGDDIRCRSQYERTTCDGEWVETAHECRIIGGPQKGEP